MDWTIILAVGALVVVLMWGPGKIPELAKSLGRARKEFDQASRGIETVDVSKASDVLIDTAHRLGIETKGLSREEIGKLIVEASR